MLAGISVWQLLIILVIVVAIFGTKKLRNTGKDLGEAVKDFRSAMREGEEEVQKLERDVTSTPSTEQKEEDKA